jgi:hypothetical protein
MASLATANGLGRELELLVSCGQLASEKALHLLSDSKGPPLNWDRFYELASVHGLQSQALHTLSLGRSGAPEALIAALRQEHRNSVARDLLLTAETLRLVRHLADHGITALVLKGCAISNSLYQPNPELRHFTDIDLLIDPCDFSNAQYYLTQVGYMQTHPTFAPHHKLLDVVHYLIHAYTFIHEHTKITVDLHHRLTPNPRWMNVDLKEVFDTAIVIKILSGEVKTLGTRVLVPYLCCHVFGHGFMRLTWLGDVARVFTQVDADEAEKIVARAKIFGAQRQIILASRLVSRIHGNETPFDRSAFPKRKLSRLENAALKMIIHAKTPSHRRTLLSLPEELSFFNIIIRLSSLRAKPYSLATLLCDPRDTLILRVSRRWLLLYLILGPFLSCRRFILRKVHGVASSSR